MQLPKSKAPSQRVASEWAEVAKALAKIESQLQFIPSAA
jgi:hypothetical protein